MISLLEVKGIAFALALSGLVVYHYTDRHAAVEAAKAANDADWAKKLDAAKAEYDANRQQQEATIADLKKSSQPEIKAKVDNIAAILAAMPKDKVKYLPANCKLPADQVAAYNSIGKN